MDRATSPHTPPPLVAVAHGSRDPRSAATVTELVAVVRAIRPDLDVRPAFLDLSAPRLPEVLSAVHAEGHRDVVVAPLLLGHAYHARVDIPGAVAQAGARNPLLRVRIADVLGPDPRLTAAVLHRLREAGVSADDPEIGLVLAGAGSSHQPANALVHALARDLRRGTLWAGSSAAFAAATEPTVPEAIAALRERGARRIAVGSWFLAPGLLPDRVAAAARDLDPNALVAAPLGAAPELAAVILDRYREALARPAQTQYA
jgi:sirohydrochlorin ferrochelatase